MCLESVMKDGHRVIRFDGMETIYDAGSNVNFDRDQLLVKIQSPTGVSGWHWDRFAALVQLLNLTPGQGNTRRCEIMLGLDKGAQKKMLISDFQAIELKPAANLLLIKGSRHAAFINMDYLKWYHIYN